MLLTFTCLSSDVMSPLPCTLIFLVVDSVDYNLHMASLNTLQQREEVAKIKRGRGGERR